MGWSALISVLIEMFAPILVDWLRALLDKWLKRAAVLLPPPSSGDARPAGAQVGALFDAAIDRLGRFAFARRAFLRRCKAVAAARADDVFAAAAGDAPVPQLSADEAAELRDVAGACEQEVAGA